MSVLVVVPARFASTRYPGKPLAMLRGATGVGKSLIQRSWEAATSSERADRVVIATDDTRIAEHAQSFGAEVVMTSTACRNGTERCAEAVDNLGLSPDIVVNLQGDAPLTPPWFVDGLVEALADAPASQAATPVLRCTGKMRADLIADRKADRVGGTTAVFRTDREALYFSKEVIPFSGASFADDEPSPVFHHVGVYAYRPEALREYPTWPEGTLEKLEGLEQLRFLERGVGMLCVEVNARGRQFWELNNPDDIPRLESMMREMAIK